jgi:hypothetical protein
MKKRLMLVALVIASLAAIPATGAAAKTPVAGCPTAFAGPYTAKTVVRLYPPPPELSRSDAEAAILRYDLNGDTYVCVQDVPGDAINVIDNNV